MANAFATNYSIPSATNVFQTIWKLTRVMKSAGWTYKASGDGTNKDYSATATADLWGGSANPLLDSYTAGSQAASTTLVGSQTFPVSSATVTCAAVGNFNATGGVFYINNNVTPVTYTACSGTTFTGCNGGPSLSATNGMTITGQPKLADNTVGWIVLSGPQVLKVPLASAPTGTPTRGEIVTQATSGATGELVSYIWDAVGVSGWAVIKPQTGTFNATNTFTGAISAAVLTPTGTVVTFAREIMFAKTATSTVAGYIHYVVADATAENVCLLSYLAAQTGCTALIPPGCGGTSNRFDTASPVTGSPIIQCVRGTQVAAGQFTSADNWFGLASTFASNAQIACTNATPAASTSADGSFWIGLPTTTANNYTGFFFTAVDDCEPGDCDPYVLFVGSACAVAASSTYTRLGAAGYAGYQYVPYCLIGYPGATTYASYFGYQSRGNTVTARDVPCVYWGTLNMNISVTNSLAQAMYPTTTLKACCTPAAAPPLVREPVSLYATIGVTGIARQAKGKCRWLQAISIGNVIDTVDSKSWLVIAAYGFLVATVPAFIIGPYDGATTPTT